MKEAKQWVGVSWAEAFFFPLHLSGRDAMRQEARLCFPVFPPWSQYHLTVVIRGDWCHCSPLSNETCHTQGAIWSSLPPPLSIVSVRSPTCYLCQQRLCLLLCIFIVHITGRKPGWDDFLKIPLWWRWQEDNWTDSITLPVSAVCVPARVCILHSAALVMGVRGPREFCCRTAIELKCSCQHVCQSWWVPLVLTS